MTLSKYDASLMLARLSFWDYCRLMAFDFYKPNRTYLFNFCETLQQFYESDDEILIINMPPRHGKSRTAQMFVQWILGNNPHEKVMTGSYNELLSTTFAKGVRNAIQETKVTKDRLVFSDVFPNVTIKKGDGSMNLWSLEGSHSNYLATSPTGTATGFGCTLLIIDDIIKNSEEAYNETVLNKHWEWFTNTMLSRLEEGGKIIIVMTRWSSMDLAGRSLSYFSEPGAKIKHINLKAVLDDGSMLCEDILSKKSYESKVRAMGSHIASANYQQEPIDLKGVLYTSFKTYSKELPSFRIIESYTDTADTGDDYLCSIVYGVTFDNEAYVLDVLYTKEPMEVTEHKVSENLYKLNVNHAIIESNNGGRGFARSIGRILREEYHNNYTYVEAFYQSRNKESRIYSSSTWVMNHIYFPENWREKWPDYYDAMTKYQKEGKNKHDDAPDCTTGISEMVSRGSKFSS